MRGAGGDQNLVPTLLANRFRRTRPSVKDPYGLETASALGLAGYLNMLIISR